jgi:hypothetical protein
MFISVRGEIMADMDEDDSPYAEVRASVSNLDDPELPGTSHFCSTPVVVINRERADAYCASFSYSVNDSSLGHRSEPFPLSRCAQHVPLLP